MVNFNLRIFDENISFHPIEIQRGSGKEILFMDLQIQSPKYGNNFNVPLNLDEDTPAQHRHAHLEHQHLDHSRQRVFKLSVQ